ncbi:hypothetical protein TNCV_2618561 [Trichonephila clavipes]|nr:hypothetical protein TNCV_2618561 [Trichonephila clavipes]
MMKIVTIVTLSNTITLSKGIELYLHIETAAHLINVIKDIYMPTARGVPRWSGPKNPINAKTTKSKAAKNVWQERAAARKQNSNQSKPSFAEVVKGSKNNSLDAKEVITKMAQMMSQWGDMLTLLQSKL